MNISKKIDIIYLIAFYKKIISFKFFKREQYK